MLDNVDRVRQNTTTATIVKKLTSWCGRTNPVSSTVVEKNIRVIWYLFGKAAFRKGERNGSPQSGKPNAVGTEVEQHPQRCYGNRFE